MRVFITGASGQLGQELQKILLKEELFLADIDNCDITKSQQVFGCVKKFKPEVVVHTAAYTDVDGCESNIDLAFEVNALGTRNIVLAANQVGAKVVYISTDFVFDGQKKTPYLEFDYPNPLSVYGQSKLIGEDYVKNLTNRYFILRTAWLYSPYGKNFVKTMLTLAEKQKEIKVVNDQVGTPTYAADLAQVIKKLIYTEIYGLYHASGSGQCSWYDFAREIFKIADKRVKVIPITSKELNRSAKRPAYSVLRNFCLEKEGIFMPSWQESLKKNLNIIINELR